jgi:isoquinoline 1-oxidoreductase beta subunit
VHALAGLLGADGRVQDVWHHLAAVGGLPGSFGVPQEAAVSAVGESPYAFSLEGSAELVDQPVRTGPWRGVFMSQTAPALEAFVDELADAAGVDPLDFRLDNITNPRMRAVLRRLRTASGWDALAPDRRGMGCVASFGSFCAVAVEVAPGPVLRKITVVADCGMVVHPSVVEGQLQGGVVDAISTVLWAAITFRDGAAQQASFADYRWARCADVPPIEVVLLPSAEPPAGVGELVYPAAAPAIMNAWSAASGRRHRSLPLLFHA